MSLKKLTCLKKTALILVTMFFLRSLITTRFMLAFSNSTFELIVCDKLANFVSVAAENGQPDHRLFYHNQNIQRPISPGCDAWSSSELLAAISFFALPTFELISEKILNSGVVFIDRSHDLINQIRAPPSLV